MAEFNQLSDEELQKVYVWVDEIPLTRPKRNIARDFSDGVLLAEVVATYFPRLVDLHNYGAANSIAQKKYNWNTLDEKVLRRIGLHVTQADIEAAVHCRPGVIERILYQLQEKMAQYRAKSRRPSKDVSSVGSIPRRSATSQQHQQRQQNVVSDEESPQPQPQPQQQQSRRKDEGMADRDETIREMQEQMELLHLKVAKLEQLLRIKDAKIQKLQDCITERQEAAA
ncbi:unnamed protein product [Chrysoparadoxa australica]